MNNPETNQKIKIETQQKIFTSYPPNHLNIYTEYPKVEPTEGATNSRDNREKQETTSTEHNPSSF